MNEPLFIAYYVEISSFDMFDFGFSIFYFELFGVFGMIFSGWISDKIFKGNRLFYIFICTIFLVMLSIIFWIIPVGYQKTDYIVVSLFGFFINEGKRRDP